ncbi:MAG: RNA polymerase factor sigma-54 [Hyphomicrobiaceae bacterium]
MALSAKLELRQGQQLVMTPQLQQAIKLLQLSNMELNAFVETELERNPLLERGEEAGIPVATGVDRPEIEPVSQISDGSLDLIASVAKASAELDADHASVDPDAGPGDFRPDLSGGSWSTMRTGNGSSSGAGDEDSNLESYVASETSLKDHLTTQLNHAFTGPAERLIGGYLIDLVDEAGYLRDDLAELADKLGAAPAMVDRVLATMQTFSPAGVFARDLKECLALQLKEQGRFDPMIATLLENLPMLAQHNLAALRRIIGCDAEDLADMIAEIRRLNPKPGLEFGSAEVSPVVPDVIVRAASDGSWLVELNNDTLPRVLVNRQYYTRFTRTARNDKDKDFLLDCLQTANWLVKSLDQRARTILRVAEEIVRQQDGFLTHGVQHMRPLNLKTIADAIKMHESTVSRVTSNKYMATPRGILELKYFFTSAIQSAGDGEAHSSESVRHRIKTLIDAERPSAILSDDKLVEILGREGVEIARRTVAKYREAMRIPSSVQRRREKRALISEAAE